jgi:hypothetical protein
LTNENNSEYSSLINIPKSNPLYIGSFNSGIITFIWFYKLNYILIINGVHFFGEDKQLDEMHDRIDERHPKLYLDPTLVDGAFGRWCWQLVGGAPEEPLAKPAKKVVKGIHEIS